MTDKAWERSLTTGPAFETATRHGFIPDEDVSTKRPVGGQMYKWMRNGLKPRKRSEVINDLLPKQLFK